MNLSHKFRNGDIYSFKTSPFNKFSEPETGRYVCLKILLPVICLGKEKANQVGFVVLDKVFTFAPTLKDISGAKPLSCTRFGYSVKTHFERMSKEKPKPNYAVSSTNLDWDNDLIDFTNIGREDLTRLEDDLRTDLRSFSA